MKYAKSALLCLLALFPGCQSDEKPQIKKAKVGDIELAYYTRGSGDPLVMIMGFRGTMAMWDPALLDLLAKKHTLIVFDNRGMGLSTDSEEDKTTISQMAQDTAGLIKALGYQKANVLGWSMGSRVALEMGMRFPDVVQNLIICAPNPGGKHQAKRNVEAFKKLTDTKLKLTEADGLALLFPDTPEGHKAAEGLVMRVSVGVMGGSLPNDMKISDRTVDRQLHSLQLWGENNDVYDQLATIKAPSLVMGGLLDVLNNPENVQIVANKIPFAWAAYLPNAGHYFLSQDHQQCAELINVFIETHKQP